MSAAFPQSRLELCRSLDEPLFGHRCKIRDTWLDILIIFLLGSDTSLAAYLGVRVTFYPAESKEKKKRYELAFISLGLIAIGLLVWQGVRNSLSQEKATTTIYQTKATVANMKTRVDLVYQLSSTWKPRPDVEERTATAKRVAKFKDQLATKRDLKSELHLIAAEIQQFAIQRAAGAPDTDSRTSVVTTDTTWLNVMTTLTPSTLTG